MSTVDDQSLRLTFDIRNRELRLIHAGPVNTRPPTGETRPFKPIVATIIGHWVEIHNAEGHTVYRRFLQNLLPLNYLRQHDDVTLEEAAEDAKLSARQAAKKVTAITKPFDITVPILEGGHELFIYEQSIPSPHVKQTRRQLHIRIDLSECQNPSAGCGQPPYRKVL